MRTWQVEGTVFFRDGNGMRWDDRDAKTVAAVTLERALAKVTRMFLRERGVVAKSDYQRGDAPPIEERTWEAYRFVPEKVVLVSELDG